MDNNGRKYLIGYFTIKNAKLITGGKSMKKIFKKLTAVIIGTAMICSLAACGNSNGGTNASTQETKKTESSADVGSGETTNTASGEVVSLKWIMVGSGMPTNYDDWKKHIDAYLEEKIGVNIDMEVVSWGDWDNRRNVIINTNEAYDILFTNAGTFTSDVRLGAFTDITDMVKTVSPELYSFIPESYWQAAGVNGQIYAVPTYKDSSRSEYFVWDKELADSYNIDYTSMHSLAEVKDAVMTISEGEGTPAYILHVDGEGAILKEYDGMGAGLSTLGVRFDDETRTVVSIFETDEVMDQLKIMNELYKSGAINSDAATLAERPTYRAFGVAQGWPSAAKTTWSVNLGVDAIAVQWGETIVSNDSVRGSMNCISSSSKNPEKALEFLQLVNTDSYLRDSLYYGLEGDDWDYTADGKIHRIKTDWPMAGYTQGTFFITTQLDSTDFNQWDEVKELNENASPSVLLGFDFDYTSLASEHANCVEIYNRYRSELLTGTIDPDTIVAAMMTELRASGFDDLMEEAQRQVDEAFK